MAKSRKSAKSVEHPVQRLFACVHHDPSDLLKHCTPECAELLQAGLENAKAEFPDVEYALGNVVKGDDRIGFTYTATGTHKETGKVATWVGAGLAQTYRGTITSVQVIEDHWGRLLDLGLLPTSPQDDITGRWTGELWGVAFTMDLSQSEDSDDVTGTITALGETRNLTGSNKPPKVELSGGSRSQKVKFSGQWTGSNVIVGKLSGEGFDTQVTLSRD